MPTKKIKINEDITHVKPVETGEFDDIDAIINRNFDDIVDISKVDTKVGAWYDWGVYSLNYICSKNLLGGVPQGRVIGVEGLPGTGKSLMCSTVMKDPRIDYVIIIETEGGGHAVELIEFAGVDKKKVRIMKANTFNSYKINKKNQEIKEIHDKELPLTKSKWDTDTYVFKEGVTSKVRRCLYTIQFSKIKKNILVILDSLGNIQSVRGLAGTPDMGKRGQDFTNFFKNFDNEFERSKVTFLFTNKMYSKMDQWDPWASTGGQSPIYNSSLYIRLSDTSETDDKSKAELNDEKERRKSALGSSIKTIRATIRKSRFGTEWRNIPFLLDFSVGPVRLSGLFTLLNDFGAIEKIGQSWYSIPGLWNNKKFRKKEFIELVMADEKATLLKLQELLQKREGEIKEERLKIQVNDLSEVENDEEDPFGYTDGDEIKKQMVREAELR